MTMPWSDESDQGLTVSCHLGSGTITWQRRKKPERKQQQRQPERKQRQKPERKQRRKRQQRRKKRA